MTFKEQYLEYSKQLNASLKLIEDIELAKKRLTLIRWKAIENLDKLLFEFETNVKKTDSQIIWCPDNAKTLENLNQLLSKYNKVNFCQHKSVKQMVMDSDIKVPELSEQPDAVVIGAKFIIANTGNFYTYLNNETEYEQVLSAKKIIVIAGIDSILPSQNHLPLAKQMYSLFEKGKMSYPIEILSRAGKPKGLNSDISLLLLDCGRSQVIENPIFRPLSYLLNFDLPPVCPLEQFQKDNNYWKQVNSLDYFIYPFLHDINVFKSHFNNNYGLGILNHYIPLDIDLENMVMEARHLSHKNEKNNVFTQLLDNDKSNLIFNPKKFKDLKQFKKYSSAYFFK